MKIKLILFLMILAVVAGAQIPWAGSVAVASSGGAPPPTDYLARYYFDNSINDATGNYTGSSFGSPTFSLGENGTTLLGSISLVAAASQYVTTTVNPSVKFTGGFTINLWAYVPTGSTGGYAYVAAVSGGSRFYLALPDVSGSTNAKLGLSSWNPVETGKLALDSWHMWTVVLSGTTGYLYLDGVQIDTQAGITVSLPNQNINLGYLGGGSNGNFNGNMDDVSVWTRPLSASEIVSLFNASAQQ